MKLLKSLYTNISTLNSLLLYTSKLNVYLNKNIKFFHLTSSKFSQASLLSQLRKETGFPLSQCKKALTSNDNDLTKALQWLEKEAQVHGWAKATKLSGRGANQGLIGIYVKGNVGGIVEVNCETDFVAKNEEFRGLVSSVVKAFASADISHLVPQGQLVKEQVDEQSLNQLELQNGKKLSDLIALTIGKLSENIRISRATRFVSPPGVQLMSYTHPAYEAEPSTPIYGRFGAVVAFNNDSQPKIMKQLCAHVVGMNPTELGSLEDVIVREQVEEMQEQRPATPEVKNELKEDVAEDENYEEEELLEENALFNNESVLVRQAFMSNPDVTVGEVLKQNDLEIIDFIRLECGGEDLPAEKKAQAF